MIIFDVDSRNHEYLMWSLVPTKKHPHPKNLIVKLKKNITLMFELRKQYFCYVDI